MECSLDVFCILFLMIFCHSKKDTVLLPSVLLIRIRIHRIHMFLGLPAPDPDPLVRGMDPDPDPPIIMQK